VRRDLVQVVVDRGDFEPVPEQPRHHTGDFLVQEHEVAHHHHLAAHLPEGRIGPQREAGLDRNTLHADGKVGARHADAEHVTRLELTGFAERLLDRLPVVVRGQRVAARPHEKDQPQRRRSPISTSRTSYPLPSVARPRSAAAASDSSNGQIIERGDGVGLGPEADLPHRKAPIAMIEQQLAIQISLDAIADGDDPDRVPLAEGGRGDARARDLASATIVGVEAGSCPRARSRG
jgi:hypothetical protein